MRRQLIAVDDAAAVDDNDALAHMRLTAPCGERPGQEPQLALIAGSQYTAVIQKVRLYLNQLSYLSLAHRRTSTTSTPRTLYACMYGRCHGN